MLSGVSKITRVVLFLFILTVSALIFLSEAGSAQDNDALTVQGIGYPPIKAYSAAQARLMARRAAIVDAYRNALVSAGHKNHDEDNLYTGISGFVRDMTIMEEEYLKDGGIRILAKVPYRSITLTSKDTTSKRYHARGHAPSKVSLDEWYEIIRPLVKIENQNQ